MKKFRLLFLTILISGFGISCSNDDDDVEVDGYDENMSIIGKWELRYTGTLVDGDNETLIEVVKEGDCPYDYLEFSEPNELISAVSVLNENNACEESMVEGTWSRNDLYLTLTEGEMASEYYIYRYYNNNLKFGKEVEENGETYVALWSYYKVSEE